jgi:CelD/BcsL family acetyltransferase involved in cellulose biosynthesis
VLLAGVPDVGIYKTVINGKWVGTREWREEEEVMDYKRRKKQRKKSRKREKKMEEVGYN